MREKISNNSIIRFAWRAFSWGVVVTVALFTVLLVGIRLLGYTPYAVLSGSMMPVYQVGDLVYVHEKAPEDIQPGEVITFVADENLTVVTHRVVGADRENRFFITKGDANNVEDGSPVLYENVVGTAAFSLPKLGYVSAYFTSPSGRYVGIAAVCVLLLFLIVPELLKSERKEKNAAGK